MTALLFAPVGFSAQAVTHIFALVRTGLLKAGAWALAFASAVDAIASIVVGRFGLDSHAYWLAARGEMYGAPPDTRDAYLYSPAFAQVLKPLALLPWPVFATLWAAMLFGVLVWLLRPLSPQWWLPLGIAAMNEVVVGNIVLLFAAVVVVGFRRPGAWSFVALTKVLPCVGPLWFLTRREWWRLAEFAVITAAIVAVSYALDPAAWAAWVEFLRGNAGMTGHVTGSAIGPPLVLRGPLGAALVVWGALTDRPWVLPAALVVLSPVLALGAFAALLALPRMYSTRVPDPEMATPLA